jgi:hypothetical protein
MGIAMKESFKKFVLGLIIGIIIAFPAGINFGRGLPFWSNPFVKRDIKERVKVKAENLLEETKEAIHDATKPTNRELDSKAKH